MLVGLNLGFVEFNAGLVEVEGFVMFSKEPENVTFEQIVLGFDIGLG